MKRRDFLKGTALATWAAIWCIPVPLQIPELVEPLLVEEKENEEVEVEAESDPVSPYWLEQGWAEQGYTWRDYNGVV